MNKKQLIQEISNRSGLSKSVSKIVLNSLIENISTTLNNGGKVILRNFGAFYKVRKKEKRYYDIHKGTIATSSPKNTAKFVPYKKFKEVLSQKSICTPIDDGSLENVLYVNTQPYTREQPGTNNQITENENPGNIAVNPTNTRSYSTYPGINISINQTDNSDIINVSPTKPTSTQSTSNVILDTNNHSGNMNVAIRKPTNTAPESLIISHEGDFIFDCYMGELEHKLFPTFKTPLKGCPILMPHPDKTGATIGVMEPVLKDYLIKMCREIKGLQLLENIKIPILNRNYSYRPDICLYWEEKKLYIDIEIDEPYDIVSRKPIHYIGNGDNLRDRYFIRNGWCVVRIAEKQIKDNPVGVVNYIKRFIAFVTNDNEIAIPDNSLKNIDRWSYEDAQTMALENSRECYLELDIHNNPNNISQTPPDEYPENVFKKPSSDILPAIIDKNGKKWEKIVEDIKKSDYEYCILTRHNGYKWIYATQTLNISSKNGENCIEGESPLGINLVFNLDKITTLEPLQNLFSDISWTEDEIFEEGFHESLNKLYNILKDAIAYGKPIWMGYTSTESGYSERFLSNLVYSWGEPDFFGPHVGLGHYAKFRLMQHFYGYCSNRKTFRMFGADFRIKELRVLNCDYVYLDDYEYANSLAYLVMNPYKNDNGNAFFENADEILRIMPQNEFKSDFAQSNVANLLVMKGKISEALKVYTQKPYNSFISSTMLTWGEACMSDIQNFIRMCEQKFSESSNEKSYYKNMYPKVILENFKQVLDLLKTSSWMPNA